MVWEVFDSGRYRYQLTFLGILLTEQGAEIERLIVRYLELLKETFEADPERDTIASLEVEAFLGLTTDQSRMLGKVLFMSPFHGGGGASEAGWSARFPHEIDDFPSQADLTKFLRAKVMERYKPGVPLNESGRALFPREVETEKELDQKFKILLSPNQAALDFEVWSNELRVRSQPIAVLFVDIDHFKALNSRHTEPKIDQTVLPQALHLLADLVRLRGGAYKYGGDEFVLILPNHNATEALAFGERVRSAFAAHKFTVHEVIENLTVSGGIALWPDHGADFKEVLQRASESNRLAKGSRNTVKLATTSLECKQPLPGSGLSVNAQRLAALLSERSETGTNYDPQMNPEDILTALGLSEEEISLAADELDEKCWVELLKTSGTGKAGFAEIAPKPKLFLETDLTLKGWNPREDAKTLAATLAKLGSDSQAALATLDQTLGWGPRRLNPAAQFLTANGYAEPIEVMGTHPYAYAALVVTARTRRLAQES